jgi:hypothetical protein
MSDMVVKRNETYVQPALSRSKKIVAAAVRKNGRVWTGERHTDLIRQVAVDTGERVYQDEQGFWTDDDRFVTRQAAAVLAWRNGQLPENWPESRVLTSDELW